MQKQYLTTVFLLEFQPHRLNSAITKPNAKLADIFESLKMTPGFMVFTIKLLERRTIKMFYSKYFSRIFVDMAN